jgi:hypothetical protein
MGGGGCLRRLLGLLFLGGILWVAWEHGSDIRSWTEDRLGLERARAEPSPELARGAMARYQALLEGRRDEASFTQEEMESVLRWELEGLLPPGTSAPTVRFQDSEAIVGMGVALEALPRIPELDGLTEILPDTVQVTLRGLLLTLEGGDAVFLVRRIEAASVPLPRRLNARIVESLGLGGGDDLPPATVPLPLPYGIRSVYIHGERLILRAAK